MPTSKDILIARYLSGNSTPKEERTLMEWLEEKPEHAIELAKAKKMWDVSLHLKKKEEADTEEAWQEFLELKEKSFVPVAGTPGTRFRVWKIAAAMVVLIALSVILKFTLFRTAEETQELSMNQTENIIPVVVPEAVEMISVFSGDSVELFMLPDSSSVYLNKHSSLQYTQNFNAQRTAYLDGEGFFEVKHNDSIPFSVMCRDLETKVVGTSFSVKSSGEKGNVEVSVLTGIVEVTDIKRPKEKIILQQEEKAVFDPVTVSFSKEKNSSDDFKWREKKGFGKKIKKFFQNLRKK